jgi:murein DD-endopeptidase MepM/ murein hydrolase activator NlpD
VLSIPGIFPTAVMTRGIACCSALFLLISAPAPAAPLGLVLPTDNDAIFSEDPSRFYMYTDRNFEGVLSKPWSGGAYGFTRDQKRTAAGIILTRLHEGVDIRPVKRDAAGEPLDEVRAIADGTVVYVNGSSSRSNYGRYVVVHHDWGDGPFFSLYAHLSSTPVTAGQAVKAGETIAKMGYTGEGINRERAHVHVELNFILSDRFQAWYETHFTTKNHHGIYNGINLTGLDIAGLFAAHRENPAITIPEFLRGHAEVHYTVLVPKSGELAFLRRYPWLGRDLEKVPDPKAWEFSFAATGVPLAIRPSGQAVPAPVVTYVKPTKGNHADFTVDRLTGTGGTATLTPSGSRYLQLITDSF